ncbi:flagellar hook-basal body complex subunit FliE [Leptothrix cholodnii SP-6]|uniref:Flagellar hook-basal body complex protein FliE n=1 Tax=Leptothrix cholodnii (strain ATCC 51168 / LMG 8142 / SP-6) TaxID=395495 RepID=B1Y383_LEPCP|nr:flagellar hook-basal body complex protein FliE [Leptothrix cholodnii]ACB33286.1 flagellar hook-basal body complex subunit FliE [Leptothrix cholodnii SP-6]
MDIKLKPFDFAQAATKAGMPQVAQRVRESAQAAGLSGAAGPAASGGVEKAGFSQVFSQALNNVSQAQMKAQGMQREVALDNPTVSLEETMVAMQRAQIGFQATLQVRNKLVQAYSDIMNMQV